MDLLLPGSKTCGLSPNNSVPALDFDLSTTPSSCATSCEVPQSHLRLVQPGIDRDNDARRLWREVSEPGITVDSE